MADVPRNIEIFNRVVGLVLSDLYEAFPSSIDIDTSSVGARASEGFTTDQGEILKLITTDCTEVVTFLAEEGFVRYRADWGDLSGKTMHSVRLTMKGLAVLGRVPAVVDESEDRRTLGTQIREAVHEGASQSLSGLVSQAFGAFVGAGARAFVGE